MESLVPVPEDLPSCDSELLVRFEIYRARWQFWKPRVVGERYWRVRRAS
jgi:hypothetical protein